MTAAVPAWNGRRVAQARALVATWLPQPCGQCGRTVDGTQPWVVGHIQPRALRPDLTWDVSNWRPEHRTCSNKTGTAIALERARLLPAGHPRAVAASALLSPRRAQADQVEPREGLVWAPSALERHDWLKPYLAVPTDAAPPLWMSPPPATAVGSYGPACIEWAREELGIELRWWQQLALVRQLEHDADGVLVHRSVVESAPRRAGKSVRIRVVALWRLAHAELLGEVQTVVHTGSVIDVCHDVQRDAWSWCKRVGWKVTVANGKEAIEGPDGSRWLVKAERGVYGKAAGLGVVDEAWNVAPATVSDGLEPTLLERLNPQLHLTSTAHRNATSLMRTRITAALTVDDPEVLLLVWAAPYGADPGDEATWRAASPHWSEDRRRMIAGKYSAALAGEADPEADDPDPMAGFEAQYLNRWRLRSRREPPGGAVVDADSWAELEAPAPAESVPSAVGVEAWFSEGVAVAMAWRVEDDVVVSVREVDDMAAAALVVRASGFRGRVQLGASLADEPAFARIAVAARATRLGAAVADLSRLLVEDVLLHDGGELLTEQVLALRTLPAPDGPRVVSKGRGDAVKAAVWAAQAARRAGSGPVRVLLPSGTR